VAERTLTRRDLNRALLARQLLLRREPLTLPAALERMGGLQAQYAPAMYIGLWSRVDGFRRADLTGALERREVVQGTLLRHTIHLVSAADFWPFAVAVREDRRAWFLRVTRDGRSADEYAAAARKLRAALARQPLRQAEIDALLGPGLRVGAGSWLEMVRVPPAGTWERRRADLYGAAEDWLGPPDVTVDDALDLLVRRYLGGFGPATRAEIANWAGVPVSRIAPALDRLPLRTFRSETGAALVDLPELPLPAGDTPVPARFLPVWDATLLVHARRTGILPEEHRSKVFHTRNPHSVNTFLVDGQVAGCWRYEGGRVEMDFYDKVPAAARRELAAEADRLATLYADQD
jgi:hypothetical protein